MLPIDDHFGYALSPRESIPPSKAFPNGGIQVQAAMCRDGGRTAKGALKGALMSIPVPGPYWVSLAAFGVGALIPADVPKADCTAIARAVSIKFIIDASGDISLGEGSSTGSQSEPLAGPVENVSTVYEDNVEVAPRPLGGTQGGGDAVPAPVENPVAGALIYLIDSSILNSTIG